MVGFAGRRSSRRAYLGVSLGLGAIAATAGSITYDRRETRIPLYSGTVVVGAQGSITEIPAEDHSLPSGTRVIVRGSRAAQEEERWMEAGSVPVVPELGSTTMFRDALLDLRTLTLSYGVTVAGWTPQWRYVWPRDSALVASAFARTGHITEAKSLLSFLEARQSLSGVFDARYLPDGSGVPDGRGVQLDGSGWALWGLSQVAERLSKNRRSALITEHRPLLDRSVAAIMAATRNGEQLPPPSSDYWEVKEHATTLATCALFIAGLLSASKLFEYSGEDDTSRQSAEAATKLLNITLAKFSPDGFPRRVNGKATSVDLGLAFLLAPFNTEIQPDLYSRWARARDHLNRPAGGLAPGGSWKNDGISWTTSTSIAAVVAAGCQDRRESVARLRWIDQHRTSQGSISEKVLFDGSPAAVAPLAWSAAAVLIAADELSRY